MLIAVRDFPSGKTVSYKIIDKAGAIIQDWTVTGVTERVIDATTETAVYQVDSGAITTGFEGHVFWKTSDAIPLIASETLNIQSVNSAGIETLLTRATELRLAELDPANLPTDIANVKVDTAAILDDTGTSGVVVASGSKAGYSLAADQSGVTVGTVNALGTQAKADVNAEVDSALNTAIPGSPTADSINQRVKAIDDLTQASGAGDLAAALAAHAITYLTVQADPNNSTLQFKTDLISSVNDFYKVWLKPRTGGLTGAGPRKVSTYNGTTKIVTLTTPFTSAPASGDIMEIITE